MDIVNGLGGVDAALALNRIAAGTFFAISGYHKLFNQERHASLVKTFEDDHIPFIGLNQWFVPMVELSAGVALVLGALSPLAAFLLLVICAVATCSDGLKRIAGWHPIDRFDWVDDLLYLPEMCYALMLLTVMLAGGGALSVDRIISL